MGDVKDVYRGYNPIKHALRLLSAFGMWVVACVALLIWGVYGDMDKAWRFLEAYGWRLVGVLVVALWALNKILPRYDKWCQQREDAAYHKNPDMHLKQMQDIQAAREAQQKKLEEDARVYAERQKELEEKKKAELLKKAEESGVKGGHKLRFSGGADVVYNQVAEMQSARDSQQRALQEAVRINSEASEQTHKTDNIDPNARPRQTRQAIAPDSTGAISDRSDVYLDTTDLPTDVLPKKTDPMQSARERQQKSMQEDAEVYTKKREEKEEKKRMESLEKAKSFGFISSRGEGRSDGNDDLELAEEMNVAREKQQIALQEAAKIYAEVQKEKEQKRKEQIDKAKASSSGDSSNVGSRDDYRPLSGAGSTSTYRAPKKSKCGGGGCGR